MNSLVSTLLRTALRPAAASTARTALWAATNPAAAPYSTQPTPSEQPAAPLASSSSSSSSSTSPSVAEGRKSLDNVIAGIKQSKKAAASRPSDPFLAASASSRSGGAGPAHSAASRYLFNTSPSARSSSASGSSSSSLRPATPEELWRHAPPVPYSLPVTTTSARSFAVRDGNVARAYRSLNRTLNENNVRRELKRQERFESPSNKRVRLNSERHRRRFKVAVGKAVSLALRTKDL